MTRIAVTPEQLVEQASRLATVPSELECAGGSLKGIADAAHATEAAEAQHAAATRWAHALHGDAETTDHAVRQLVAAAKSYVGTDQLYSGRT